MPSWDPQKGGGTDPQAREGSWVGKGARQDAVGQGRGAEGVPADSWAGEGGGTGEGTEADHADHEEAVLFTCWFSSSKSQSGTRANRGLRGFTSPSPFLFLRLSSGVQLPGSSAELSDQRSPYCPEKYRLSALSCCLGTSRAQGARLAEPGAARTMPGELLFEGQCQEPPLMAACSRGAHPAVPCLKDLLPKLGAMTGRHRSFPRAEPLLHAQNPTGRCSAPPRGWIWTGAGDVQRFPPGEQEGLMVHPLGKRVSP